MARGRGERREGRFKRLRGAQHRGEIEVAVRAAAAPVHQCGLRCQLRLVYQCRDGELGKARIGGAGFEVGVEASFPAGSGFGYAYRRRRDTRIDR